MPTKKQLERQRLNATNALWEIERKEKIKKHSALVGKCFRYRNSYGSDSRWWLYGCVTSINDDGWLKGFTFETTSNDEIQIKPEQTRMSFDGWEKISRFAFVEAWLAVQARIAGFDGKTMGKGTAPAVEP